MRWSYWFGPDSKDRRIAYAGSFRPEFQQNGDNLQERARAAVSYVSGQHSLLLPEEEWASGWRPPEVNESTANAGKLSTHLTAEAGDRKDTVDGSLCWAFFNDPHPLQVHGLYMEHPVATVVRSWELAFSKWKAAGFVGECPKPNPWCHMQTRQPASGNRVYWPDAKAQKEWATFLSMGGHPGISFTDWLVLRRAVEAEEQA